MHQRQSIPVYYLWVSSNPAKDNVYVGYDQSRTEFAIGFTDNHAGDSDITV
jgi:hypothetical protein